MAPSLPSTRPVYVADREADLMALMERAQALGTPADWLLSSALGDRDIVQHLEEYLPLRGASARLDPTA
jgi:hypothetical protein